MTELLRVEGLSRRFGGLLVASDISLTLSAGERVALIGPNGAGKTTFLNLVTGALKPSSGRIFLGGEDVTRLTDVARVRRGLARSFQISRLIPDLTVREHMALAILSRSGKGGSLTASVRAPDVEAESSELLERLGLRPVANDVIAEIAYGQQRLIELAFTLALRPKVLLLDEPAAGVPRAETGRILQALADLPPNLGVLMIEHDMDLVARFATRVVVLAAGRVIAAGKPAIVMADPTVRQAYLGSYADARRPAA